MARLRNAAGQEMQHANVEYSYLARVLPNLYNGEKESADTMAIAW